MAKCLLFHSRSGAMALVMIQVFEIRLNNEKDNDRRSISKYKREMLSCEIGKIC